MVEKKRIVLIIPALHAGGMERVMSELAAYFAAKPFIDLHLVLYGIKRDVFYTLPSDITIHKPSFEFTKYHRFIASVKTLFFVRKKLKSLQPGAILSFGEYWNSFVLLAIIGLKLPVYVSDRCQPDKTLGFIHRQLRKYLYPTAKGIIAQTEKAKKIYQTFYLHNNIRVIGNPIRPIDPSTVKKENIVLSVGRLIKTKNHYELIKLFTSINKPGWKLVIVGDDAIKQKNFEKLKALVASLNAQETVVLAGKQTDVEQFYNKSKIFAFTSSSEGFPNVIGEAQSAGLPVVAFDCIAGPADMVVDEQNGYLVPMFDYTGFKSKLSTLMSSEDLRMQFGNKARIDVQRYNQALICEKYLAFILNNQSPNEP